MIVSGTQTFYAVLPDSVRAFDVVNDAIADCGWRIENRRSVASFGITLLSGYPSLASWSILVRDTAGRSLRFEFVPEESLRGVSSWIGEALPRATMAEEFDDRLFFDALLAQQGGDVR